MRNIILALCFLLVCSKTFAQECYYVYIDKNSPIINEVKGQNEKGDVIDVVLCSKITPPEHDFKNFDIIKMKLTEVDALELKNPLFISDASLKNGFEIEKARKHKINVKTLTEQKEYTKDEIFSKITSKSAVVTIIVK